MKDKFYPKTEKQIYWGLVKDDFRRNKLSYVVCTLLCVTVIILLSLGIMVWHPLALIFVGIIILFPLTIFYLSPRRHYKKWKEGEKEYDKWLWQAYEESYLDRW